MKPILQQINLVCDDLDASLTFYRMLGVELPEDGVWRTASGGHHARAEESSSESAIGFDFAVDSAAHAQTWNAAWHGRADLGGRVFIGFGVATRADVDALFGRMTGAGYRALQEPWDAHWGARLAIVEDCGGHPEPGLADDACAVTGYLIAQSRVKVALRSGSSSEPRGRWR